VWCWALELIQSRCVDQVVLVGQVPKEIVLYSGRHAFGTRLMASTGDISLVMRAMGHSSVQTAMIYQHPDLERVRSVMDLRFGNGLKDDY
jgi:site-specific recombinase XerD